MSVGRMTFGTLLLATIFSSALSTGAHAWGCHAQGAGTNYGYSYGYSTRSDAESRALRECAARGSGCRITSCDPNK